ARGRSCNVRHSERSEESPREALGRARGRIAGLLMKRTLTAIAFALRAGRVLPSMGGESVGRTPRQARSDVEKRCADSGAQMDTGHSCTGPTDGGLDSTVMP